MSHVSTQLMVPDEVIENKIYLIRGINVMLDRDLALLYDVETRVLKQAVKRNMDIFPEHFMFEMNKEEFQNWRSQFVTSKADLIGLRHLPFCFTEYGVVQLAHVLKSKRARQMSVRITEVFVKLKKIIADNAELRLTIEKLERKSDNHTKNIELIFHYVTELQEKQEKQEKLELKPRKPIGYKLPKLKKTKKKK